MPRAPQSIRSVVQFLVAIVATVFTLLGTLLALSLPLAAQEAQPAAQPGEEPGQTQTGATPVFRFPIVPAAEISSYFDHDPAAQSVRFYDGRSAASGFVFSCPQIGDSWVGCADAAGSSEAACANDSELWYDEHHGTDFEYTTFWRTGASCDIGKFGALTVTVLAPAAGIVDLVGEDDPYNGNYIRIYHDVDGDGDYYNDGLRSYYLHFADNGILVDEGQVVAEGDELGYGDTTGMAWTPHLHFEVQQRTGLGWVAVDPFGWQAADVDPWYVAGRDLWQTTVAQTP